MEVNKIKAKEFIDEIIEISMKHGLSLAHEDSGGGFYVMPYDEYNIEWLKEYFIRDSY